MAATLMWNVDIPDQDLASYFTMPFSSLCLQKSHNESQILFRLHESSHMILTRSLVTFK